MRTRSFTRNPLTGTQRGGLRIWEGKGTLTLTPSHLNRVPRFVSAKDPTNEGKFAPLLVFVLSTLALRAIGV